MIIGHYSDIQVYLTEYVGMDLTRNILNNVTTAFTKNQVDVVVCAGDIFDKKNPQESERLLISNHFIDVLKIPTLKYFFIFLGNHDYEDESSSKDINKTSNPIDTLTKIIESIDPDLRKKIVYLKKQIPYDIDDLNMTVYSYSLEDGKSHGNNIINYRDSVDYNRFNLTVHHDIVYEYVEQANLPLNQHKKDSLIRLNSDQFFTDIILGGDIHQHITLLGNSQYPNRKYYYTGNIFERNYGEGSYTTINKNVTKKPSYIRGVNIHHVEDKDIIKTDFIEIPKLIGYFTIDVNTNRVVENLNEKLQQTLNEFQFGESLNFIRFKMAQMYAPIEGKLREFIKMYFEQVRPTNSVVNVEFIWDKQSTQLSNDIVETMKLNSLNDELKNNNISQQEYDVLKSVICDGVDIETALSEGELSDIKSETFSKLLNENMQISDIISDENVDESLNNILLSKAKIIDLFKLQLETNRATILKQVGTTESTDKIINEINTRFEKELTKYYRDNSQYSVKLLLAKFNLFCQLGENEIDLNIYGRTRIKGSNGVGKTSLYNFIRYMIKGVIFTNLKANQKVKNTSLIFNIFKPNEDVSNKVLEFTVNGTLVKLTRNDTRIWKSSANKNEKLKRDTNWNKYIETIKSEVKLEYGDVVEYNADIIQQKLDLWFGDTVETTLIIDKHTIPEMLNRGGNDLRGLVMEHLAPYLNHLEDDLRNVKEEYKIVKPSLSLGEIFTKTNELNIQKTDINTRIDDNNKSIENNKNCIENDEKSREIIKDKLISIGDVDLMLNEAVNNQKLNGEKLDKLNVEIQQFEPKDLPEFTLTEPIKNVDQINEIKTRIDTNKTTLEANEKRNLELVKLHGELTSKLTEDLNDKINTESKTINNKLNEFYNQFNDIKVRMDSTLLQHKTDLDNYKSELRIVFNNRVNELNNLRDEANRLLIDCVNKIQKLETNINNSFCGECKRDYDTTDTKHIEESKAEIERLNNEKTTLSKDVSDKSNKRLNYQNGDVDYIKSVCDESPEHKQKYDELVSKYERFDALLKHEIYSVFLNIMMEFKNNIYNHDNLPNIDRLIASKIIHESFKNEFETTAVYVVNLNALIQSKSSISSDEQLTKYKDELLAIVNSINTLRTDIKTDESLLDEINNNHDKLVKEYTESLTKYNNDIIEVNNHNKSIHQKQIEVESINEKLTNLVLDIERLSEHKVERDALLESDKLLVQSIKNLDHDNNEKHSQINNLKDSLNSINNDLNKLDELEQDNIEFLHNSIIYKMYETMIKKSFKSDVFSYYKTFLNSTLNLLLEDSKFKLIWHEDGELYYSEIRNGEITNIPVIMVSGMQEIFLGLSLIFTLSLLNTRTNVNVMFIDEISGSLNNGKGLKHTKDIVDYQNQLLLLLDKFGNKNMFIIDHVIENLYETESYEVIITESGSKYIKN